MFPTNDPAQRRVRYCSRVCPTCNVSECVTPGHQDWDCRCGHHRTQHMGAYGWFTAPGYYHPHPCLVMGCSCKGLVYATFEDMVALLEQVVEDTRPNARDDSDTPSAPSI